MVNGTTLVFSKTDTQVAAPGFVGMNVASTNGMQNFSARTMDRASALLPVPYTAGLR